MRRRLRSNNSTILKLAMVGIVAMAGGFLLTSLMASKGETQALSATEFQPGRIIDDSIFYNPNTMTAAEIDAFIDSHNPACDTWGTQKVYGNVTRAEYVKQLRASGNTKYHDPPFVCISEYYENPETHKTNFSTGGKKEEGMLSAGEIIYKAAQEYSINPQVLLVMLKKESYVWGDDWPHNFQYNTVMGYACPDGAPCDTKYYGFYNQVMMAAWQLNYYRDHIYSYNYRPYTTNNILYNPDRSCGSKSVYLENIATTSLYIYTPYVPNDAALANYPGTSWCGSYGNRNFYMYFREWFRDVFSTSWTPMTTPRVLTAKTDTLKIDAATNSIGSEWIHSGESFMFSSKKDVYINGEVYSCLRTSSDEANGMQSCILFSRLQEYTPEIISSDTQHFLVSKYTCLVHLRNTRIDCNDSLNPNELFSTSKTTEIDGVVYLLKDDDEMTGYRIDRFQNINLILYEEAKDAFVSEETKKYSINFNKTSNLQKGLVRLYGELVVDNGLYYLLNKSGEIYVIDSEHIEETSFYPFVEPRYMIIDNSAQAISLTGSTTCHASEMEFFNRKTYLNGELYYLYGEENCGVNASAVKEISSLISSFVTPRNIVVTKNARFTDLVHGNTCEEIKENKVMFFSKKISLGDNIYYIASGESFCGVLNNDTIEVNSLFVNFLWPRRMRIDGNFVDLFTGENCKENPNDTYFFNTKIDKDGVSYYRTKEDTDTLSTCVISSNNVKELLF